MAGEIVHTVEPLDVEGEAVELFVERARTAWPPFSLEAANRREVSALVAQLDGLPLAIELAAARSPVLSPAELRQRLTQRLQLLRGRRDDVRRGSLQGALDASWELLSAGERAALVQCSVFAGCFGLQDASAVLELEQAPEDVLQALVEHHLLYSWSMEGRPRLGMYATVRAWAASREPQIVASAAGRHLAHFAALGSPEALRRHHGPDGAQALARLSESLEDLALATHRAVERGEVPAAVGALSAACAALEHTGPLLAAVPLCDKVLALELGRAERARTLGLRGWMWLQQGELERASADLEEALALADEPRLRASRAGLRRARGDLSGAWEDFERAREAYHAQGDAQGAAATEANLATLSYDRGELESSVVQFRRALAQHHALGDKRGEATILGNLGSALAAAGLPEEAARCYGEAVVLHRELGYRVQEAVILGNLAAVRLGAGALDEAEALLRQALELHRQVGNRRGEAATCASLGKWARLRGPPADPRPWFERAMGVLEQIGDGALLERVRRAIHSP
jgi:tetratricopeptide (TPR) repeat protein